MPCYCLVCKHLYRLHKINPEISAKNPVSKTRWAVLSELFCNWKIALKVKNWHFPDCGVPRGLETQHRGATINAAIALPPPNLSQTRGSLNWSRYSNFYCSWPFRSRAALKRSFLAGILKHSSTRLSIPASGWWTLLCVYLQKLDLKEGTNLSF